MNKNPAARLPGDTSRRISQGLQFFLQKTRGTRGPPVIARFHLRLLPLALLGAGLGQPLMAQQIPGAGSQIQQIPAVPTPPPTTPELRVEPVKPAVAPASAATRILVNTLQITGSKVYAEKDLLAIAGFVPGTELSLVDLRAMAARITAYYANNGYFAAQAYLPAQDIQNNTVTIAVREGEYGQVILKNESRLSDGIANNLLGGLNRGDTIAAAPLESRLLLLSDIPGIKVNSTLTPGASPGTSDLIVNITPGKPVSGSVDADNAGNRYTGEYRLGATVSVNNPLGLGDIATFRGVTAGRGLNYGLLSYELQAGKGRVGASYSRLNYSLGKEFESLKANGTAEVASVYGSYPLLRSRDTNLYARLGYDHKTFEDRIDSVGAVTNKKDDVLTASLYGNHRDNIGGGGYSAYSLTGSAGQLDIRTPAARAADAITARSNGSWNKLAFNAMRLQRLTDSVSLYGSLSGQVASKNLDPSEKMELGGMNGVRAYPQGEAAADQGYLLTLEARLLLPRLTDNMAGQMHLIGFVDHGSVTINKNPWAAGNNQRTLSATGVGLTWSDPGNFLVRMYYARKLGNETALSAPDKSGRFWIQAVKYF